MEAILAQLSGVRETLQADGYDLQVDGLEGGQLTLTIVALDGACEECLVPKEIMQRVIANNLDDPSVASIELRYPAVPPTS